MKTLFLAILNGLVLSTAMADPQITSWFTVDSSHPAQIYRSDADKSAGRTEMTWRYIMGRRFHGNPVGRIVRGVYEPVVTNFVNAANTLLSAPSSPATTTMIWNPGNRSYDTISK